MVLSFQTYHTIPAVLIVILDGQCRTATICIYRLFVNWVFSLVLKALLMASGMLLKRKTTNIKDSNGKPILNNFLA